MGLLKKIIESNLLVTRHTEKMLASPGMEI